MKQYCQSYKKHCRWCGKAYHAYKPVGRDGFHSQACKQAHYRAYKAYVTRTSAGCRQAAQRRRTVK